MKITEIINPKISPDNLADGSIIKVTIVKQKNIRVDIWCEKVPPLDIRAKDSRLLFLPSVIWDDDEAGASCEESYPTYEEALERAKQVVKEEEEYEIT
jgi:hypothetical protein